LLFSFAVIACRLAPVPIRFWANPRRAREVAAAQSFSTHPGPIAACCCEFLAFAIARAIAEPNGLVGAKGGARVADWLDATAAAFVEELDAEGLDGRGWSEVRRLLASCESEDSTERCWNWRAETLDINHTLCRRGGMYNGYPVRLESEGNGGGREGGGVNVVIISVTRCIIDAWRDASIDATMRNRQ
jgi:hypothetical protein